MHASDAVSEAHAEVAQKWSIAGHLITLHRVLPVELKKLCARMVAVYSELPNASDPAVREDVTQEIRRRASSFLQSCNATYGPGNNAAGVARQVVQLHGNLASIPREFDLAVHKRLKQEGPIEPPAPIRAKQQKFGILDCGANHYESDFKAGVGALGIVVVFFDLDNFKEFNTRFSEPVVDREILPELQKLILALMEGRGYAYAEGGDEFVITLPNTNIELATPFVEVLLEALRDTEFSVNDELVTVTASAGIAWTEVPTEWQACRDAAAIAKQRAKTEGRDRYAVAGLES
tara:strand:- start:842 stop:1714 length:873 start_codon:yes stop_codon:yes gene_type:complete